MMTIHLRQVAPRLVPFLAAGALGACSVAGESLWPEEDQPVLPAPETMRSLEIPLPLDSADLELPPPATPPSSRVADAELPPRTSPAAPSSPPAAAPAPLTVASRTPPPMAGAPTAFLRLHAANLANELSGLAGLIDGQRAEFEGLAYGAAESAALYTAAVDAVNERLRAGAAPDDPILVSQWQSAESALKAVSAAYSNRLRALNERIATNRGMTAYLSESTRAVGTVHDALGVDRGALAGVETGLAQIMGENERLLAEIGEVFARYAAHLDDERGRVAALALPAEAGAPPAAAPPQAAVAEAPPLLTIRFARSDVAYEDALYDAVSAALERRPGARFELVAVSPVAATGQEAAAVADAAGRNAERVMESLVAMNLPAERVRLAFLTSPDVEIGEVRLFVR